MKKNVGTTRHGSSPGKNQPSLSHLGTGCDQDTSYVAHLREELTRERAEVKQLIFRARQKAPTHTYILSIMKELLPTVLTAAQRPDDRAGVCDPKCLPGSVIHPLASSNSSNPEQPLYYK